LTIGTNDEIRRDAPVAVVTSNARSVHYIPISTRGALGKSEIEALAAIRTA
jgi:hypothetical protein